MQHSITSTASGTHASIGTSDVVHVISQTEAGSDGIVRTHMHCNRIAHTTKVRPTDADATCRSCSGRVAALTDAAKTWPITTRVYVGTETATR